MSKLTDTQLVILSAAAGRDDGAVLPVPKSIKAKGGALTKVIDSMIARGLIYECPVTADDQTWREDEAGNRHTLRITDAGLRVIGADSAGDDEGQSQDATATAPGKAAQPFNGVEGGDPEPETIKKADGAESGQSNKQTALIALLERDEGATINEMMAATGWQAHSVRGAISGTLKKKLGLTVTSEKTEDRGRVYRIAGDPA